MSQLTAVVVRYAGCTITEVLDVVTRLANKGATVRFVAPTTTPLLDQSGLRVLPDSDFAGVDPAEVSVLIVPGGDPGSVIGNAVLSSLVRNVLAAGSLCAGICGGVAVLADAQVLVDRQVTHNYRSPWAPDEVVSITEHLWVGAHVTADLAKGVVVDGNLVTALPNATAEFAVAVCQALGLYDEREAQLLQRHLQGSFVPELFQR